MVLTGPQAQHLLGGSFRFTRCRWRLKDMVPIRLHLSVPVYDKQKLAGESYYRLLTRNGEFIYMRTRGCLQVNESSRDVTTFVCTNTAIEEKEGRILIQQMKNKYSMMINNRHAEPENEDDEVGLSGSIK